MKATREDVREILGRLQAIYGVPAGAKANQVVFEDEWCATLDGFSRFELMKAVDTWRNSTEKYWPKPGDMRRLAYEARTPAGMSGLENTYRTWDRTGWGARSETDPLTGGQVVSWTACPVCGAVPGFQPLYEGGVERLRVIHVAARHKEARIVGAGDSDESAAYYARQAAAPVPTAALPPFLPPDPAPREVQRRALLSTAPEPVQETLSV